MILDMLISPAFAEGGVAPQSDPLMTFLPLVVLFAVFYFMLIRPQQKKAKQHKLMVAELKRGDEVVTHAGIIGRIVATDEMLLHVEIAARTVVTMQRSGVSALMPKGAYKPYYSERSSSRSSSSGSRYSSGSRRDSGQRSEGSDGERRRRSEGSDGERSRRSEGSDGERRRRSEGSAEGRNSRSERSERSEQTVENSVDEGVNTNTNRNSVPQVAAWESAAATQAVPSEKAPVATEPKKDQE